MENLVEYILTHDIINTIENLGLMGMGVFVSGFLFRKGEMLAEKKKGG